MIIEHWTLAIGVGNWRLFIFMFTPSVFTSVINSYLPEPHASLLNGILFGINLKTTKVFYEQLKMVGLLHIVVLSGTNISFLAVIIGKLTSVFSKPISVLITILTVILFIAFVGAQAPIIRAGVMGILTLVAIIYGKKNTALYSLFLSAIFIAIFWPRWLTTISFQLSYAAVFGIILFGSSSVVKTSLAAQLFTAPIIFFYFKQISLIAPLSNFLVAPFIAPLMILGFIAAILGKINFYLGIIPAYLCYGILSYMIWVIETLSKLPFGYFGF